ncbi:hypothetical protein [Cellulomonas endophytica]|uniref:hypothetical protein n=1 Tax=Cellulomonas endophytica TaxID=2494735 RepID=UPI0010108C5C|nr:hypothetical protein [Cellulomonas endophytica]
MAAARAGGAVAAVLARAVRAAGRERPLHPVGTRLVGTVTWTADGAALGLGRAGATEPVEARRSRAAGLPAPLPDVVGLALRWGPPGAPRDVLLASAGTGPVARFLLAPRRPGGEGTLSTLMPFRSRLGPLVLLVVPGRGYAPAQRERLLLGAIGAGPPGVLARLVLEDTGEETDRRFDPVRHRPPSLPTYAWAAALRRAPYAAARGEGRDEGRDGHGA